MKNLLLAGIICTLLTGEALASTPQPATQTLPAPVIVTAPKQVSVGELFGDVFKRPAAPFALGFQVAAACECIEFKEVCSRACELWNQNGTCAKWAAELVCHEKCVKYDCER